MGMCRNGADFEWVVFFWGFRSGRVVDAVPEIMHADSREYRGMVLINALVFVGKNLHCLAA